MAGDGSTTGGKDTRAERLARALRANLHRRKARARQQDTARDPAAEGTGAEPAAGGDAADGGEAVTRPGAGKD